MLTASGSISTPLGRHLRSHGAGWSVGLLLTLAAGLAWWGDRQLMFPHLADGPAIPVTGGQCVPLLMACVLVLSLLDGMRDFSEHAARPRRQVVVLHLGSAVLLSLALATAALLAAGAAAELLVAVRNLLGFLGLAAAGAALLGPGLSWTLPLAWATPVFTLASASASGSATSSAWWEWPSAAPGDSLSWALALGFGAVGLLALLARTGSQRGAVSPRFR